MKNKTNQIIILNILLFTVLGCSAFRKLSEVSDKNSKPKTVSSKDNKIQLTVPKSWSTKTKLNADASLEVSQPFQELYAVVIPDSKSNFDKTADIDWFTDIVKNNLTQNIQDGKFSKITSLRVNGFKARRFEAKGVVEKIKIGYVFTIVETPDHFYQVMTWTLQSYFTKNKPILIKVSDSFRLKTHLKSNPPPSKAKD